MPDQSTHFAVVDQDGVFAIEFTDRKILDELSINEIGDEIAKLAALHAPMKLLLNFKNVQHLSSAALGMLITLSKKMEGLRSRMKLCDINPQIYEVFKITKLNRLFDIHDTADSAKASFMHG